MSAQTQNPVEFTPGHIFLTSKEKHFIYEITKSLFANCLIDPEGFVMVNGSIKLDQDAFNAIISLNTKTQ